MMTLPSNVLASALQALALRFRAREREREERQEGGRWTDRVQMQCNYGDEIVLELSETDDTAHL